MDAGTRRKVGCGQVEEEMLGTGAYTWHVTRWQ